MKTLLIALTLVTSACSGIGLQPNREAVWCYMPDDNTKTGQAQIISEYNSCISTAATLLQRNGCMEAKGYKVDLCDSETHESTSGRKVKYIQ